MLCLCTYNSYLSALILLFIYHSKVLVEEPILRLSLISRTKKFHSSKINAPVFLTKQICASREGRKFLRQKLHCFARIRILSKPQPPLDRVSSADFGRRKLTEKWRKINNSGSGKWGFCFFLKYFLLLSPPFLYCIACTTKYW